MTNWINRSAEDCVAALNAGVITPEDLLDALEARITAIDGAVNALPTLCFDRARDRARRLRDVPPSERGPLAGLPLPIKDSAQVAGVRTTYGSPIFADHVPDRSDVQVETIERHGGIVYAKSNTPEFEAGANTFNEVFGATRNPWHLDLSAAGSSGGAAAAVAAGMAWVAQGSDFACSLRAPASFCGVVGLRPSPGLVAQGPLPSPYQTLSVIGPIARNVGDLGLLLDAMCGLDRRDPLSFASRDGFREAARRPRRPVKIAYSPDLGITPVDPVVRSVCADFVERLRRDGIEVEETAPDMTGAHDTFRVLRSYQYAVDKAGLLADHRDKLKPEVVWNIEQGLKLDMAEIVAAERRRGELVRNMAGFLAGYDLLITPTMIVPPYPIEQRYVAQCDGVDFPNYLEWMAIAYAITLTSCPALSLPAGLSGDGLPIGVQLVAGHRREAEMLSWAAYLEALTGFPGRLPVTPAR